ncbi:MAG: hypothetical protein LBB48_07110 [Treponema sp.]|jgi:hypothetical protein|nr:hypothetical protein [Treponema sp.]
MNKQYSKAIVTFAFAAFCAAFLSCGGSPSAQRQPAQEYSLGSAPKKYPNSHEKAFWNTSTSEGDLIIVGVGGIQMYDAGSVQKALEDAARKVALFTGLRGAAVYYENIGASFWHYSVANATKFDYNEDYLGYIEELRYDPDRDVIINERGAFVRVRYKLPDPFHAVHPSSGDETKKPDWVVNPPLSIAGFIAGVGYARPQMYPSATYVASYEAAIANLVSKGSNSITATNMQVEGEGYNYEDIRESTVIASAVINGFYILQVWVDPADGGVYTLAIAQSVKGL